MNNWHLLLLALVATFQLIAAFTERNLVDGREQCCGRKTDPIHRDSPSSLYGVRGVTKDSHLQRVNYRDDTRDYRDDSREGRDHELRQRDVAVSRKSSDRSLLEFRERDSIGRSSRPERVVNDRNRENHLNLDQRQRTFRTTRLTKREDQNRRILSRVTRSSVMRHDDRVANTQFSRNILSRVDSRQNLLNNEFQIRNIRSQTERLQTRSGDLRRLTMPTEARDNLRESRESADHNDAINTNRQNTRERVNLMQRQSRLEDNLRLSRHIGERRDTRLEQRRSLSEKSVVVERVRDMRLRINARQDRAESRERIDVNRRLTSERIESGMLENERRNAFQTRRSHQREVRDYRLLNDLNIRRERDTESRRGLNQNRKTPNQIRDRRLTSERMEGRTLDNENVERRHSDQTRRSRERDIREYRSINYRNTEADRTLESWRELNQNEKISGKIADESLARHNRFDSRKMLAQERDSRMKARQTRSADPRSFRGLIDETESRLRRSAEVVRGRDETESRFRRSAEVVRGRDETRRSESRNRMLTRAKDTLDSRSRNYDLARNREIMTNKIVTESVATSFDWQYIFYSLQGAYLCSLLVQLLTPKHSEKSNTMSLRWWPLSSQKLIKVD